MRRMRIILEKRFDCCSAVLTETAVSVFESSMKPCGR